MGDRGGMAINYNYSRSSAGSTGDRRFPDAAGQRLVGAGGAASWEE
jgi:hypothetical protein